MNDKVKADTPEQEEFRAYCREWLSKNRPDPAPAPAKDRSKAKDGQKTRPAPVYSATWQKLAYEGGLVGCDYPKEYGGGGHTDCQRIANEEMQRAECPGFASYTALQMGTATLLTHGSEYLKKRFIPKMFSGEEMWCQGFSEPNAGSDIANQETFAEKRGDNWVINGQKVWTSGAVGSDWMILLTRTDRSHKHKGLTYFVCPMKENLGKSVEIRPLVKITGETGFNEVFLKDVTVPDKYRLGEEGEGWAVAMTTLMYERDAGTMLSPTSGARAASSESDRPISETPIIRLAKAASRNGKTAADDPVIRDRIVQLMIRQAGLTQTNRRAGVKGLVDHPSRISLQVKLVFSEIDQDLAALAIDIGGVGSTLRPADKNAPMRGIWPHQYIDSFSMTISQGTSEIQRNQIGERVLGMPKSK